MGIMDLSYPAYRRTMNDAQKRLLGGSKILNTDEGDIEYAVLGGGTPVLLLHGAGGGYDQGLWLGKMSLGEGYKFISVSRFGYLRLPIPENASIKTQAALYKVLLDHLDLKRVTVVGGSAGGPSATQFANDYPERTSALILLSAVSMSQAAGDKNQFYVNIIHLLQQSDYAYWLVSKFMRPMVLNLMGIPSQVYNAFTAEQKELAREMLEVMHPMSQRYKGTINDGKMMEHYDIPTDGLCAPTLIIHAKDDALVSYEHAESAHKKIKQSRLVSFDTGGHGMLPQMDKVRRYVREFLKP
jgi:pimeloyl-ACP methyl ester carboxylesterase